MVDNNTLQIILRNLNCAINDARRQRDPHSILKGLIEARARVRSYVPAKVREIDRHPPASHHITAEWFEQATGRKPENDDLDRVNCLDAGKVGHLMCGWDMKAGKPVFETGAIVRKG